MEKGVDEVREVIILQFTGGEIIKPEFKGHKLDGSFSNLEECMNEGKLKRRY